ncbi:phospholipid/cholesterol/gamma-HCH transport system substrate-binding protein [Rhodococcus sp. SMB37]|uniref:MCE family protein n=1 Tax=Rhodococcus sp. SMB37 TaxID=2512213 RepID=UPI001051F906|nr:MlaD family protein [Rhodococcus sp. SMB37]TCN43872.1 phospholipid/cholesterol/gamma-HCH transport system substrate-binding protein [Rhodococcus sp. SMB37]
MTRTAVGAGIYATVMLLILGGLFVVFGQVRFGDTTEFRAVFDDVSGLEDGQFVRVSGVEVGKVSSVDYTDGNRIEIAFDVESSYTPTRATVATVRYLNLVGDRYLELSDGPGDATPMEPGEAIGTDRTEPALDLDVLIGSFKPLFRALEPDQVNQLSADLITVLQGQGGSVESILVHAASLTSSIADRDALVGQVVANLESVLANLAAHSDTFDAALHRAQQLASGLAQDSTLLADSVAHIDAAGAEVAALLTEARAPLSGTIRETGNLATLLDSRSDTIEQLTTELPEAYASLTRLGAYGGFFNYYLCGMLIKVSDPSGNTITSPLFGQTTGRCAPQ